MVRLFSVLLAILMTVACNRDRDDSRNREGLVGTGLSSSRSRPAPPERPGTSPLQVMREALTAPADAPAQVESDASTTPTTDPSPDAGAALAPIEPALNRQSAADQDPIAAAGAELLASTEAAAWSLDGSLSTEDLTIRISTEVTNRRGEVLGAAGFNLNVHSGFSGAPKCNLLAFEIAYRAGFVVPLVGRAVGWGFPSSEMLANDALDYRIAGDWAEIRRRPVAREVNLDRENGHAFLVVARSATYGRPGHVAMLDWIEEMALTRDGEIRMLAFMGWEANVREGARYTRIVFATTQAVPYSRFDRVYLIELRAAEPGNEVALIGRGPRNPTDVVTFEGSRQEGERSQ